MCGIFGWWGNEEKQQLETMANQLRHRGPDGEGYFHNASVGIGMTRLAIIDDVGGSQPMNSQDGMVTVVCNGEIYNFETLKNELKSLGYRFTTDADCEVLPAAYQAWGLGMLERLNGMFAIALYDLSKDRLFLMRDRCGQKPLYYSRWKGNFYFASEIRALHAIGLPKELNEEAIASYLALRYVAEPETLFGNIQILPAGCYWSSHSDEVKRWWEVGAAKAKNHSNESLAQLTSSAIRSALVSDHPMAVHLSAGIDSSILLCEAVRSDTEVSAVTAAFEGAADESQEAAQLAKKLNVQHHITEVTPLHLRDLPRVVEQMELPVGDALIVAFDQLARATKELGAKVALGGEGIDEMFGGYAFQKAMLLTERLGKQGRWLAAKSVRAWSLMLGDRVAGFPAALGKSGCSKIRDYLQKYDQMEDWEKGVSLRMLFDEVNLSSPVFPEEDGSLLGRHLRFQFSGWMQDWSIIRQERNGMAHSVEYRMPFLDHRLLEHAMALPDRAKIGMFSNKVAWRRMGKQKYPEVVSARAKQAFYFPVQQDSYFIEIMALWDGYLSGPEAMVFDYFSREDWRAIRAEAELSRDFLLVKKGMALVILEIWLRQHFPSG